MGRGGSNIEYVVIYYYISEYSIHTGHTTSVMTTYCHSRQMLQGSHGKAERQPIHKSSNNPCITTPSVVVVPSRMMFTHTKRRATAIFNTLLSVHQVIELLTDPSASFLLVQLCCHRQVYMDDSLDAYDTIIQYTVS